MNDLVSVIIPTYNRAYIVGVAIQSVLAQTYPHWELIVVDDGSTDETRALVEGYREERIRYIYQENKGQSAARNRGLEMARGEWVAFLDSDNEFLPTLLETILRALAAHPDKLCAVPKGHRTQELYENGKLVQVVEAPQHPPENVEHLGRSIVIRDFIFDMNGFIQSILIRDEGIRFDEGMRGMEDWDYAIMIAERYPESFLYVPEILYNYHQRYGGDGIVSNTAYGEFADQFERIYQKHKQHPLMVDQTWYPERVEKWKKIQRDFEAGLVPPPHLYRFQT